LAAGAPSWRLGEDPVQAPLKTAPGVARFGAAARGADADEGGALLEAGDVAALPGRLHGLCRVVLADVGDRLAAWQSVQDGEAGQCRTGSPVSAGAGDLDTFGTSAIRTSAQHWSSSHPQAAVPASSTAASSRTCAGLSLEGPPPGPFEASAARPPAASARRHRFADTRVTRKLFATSRSLAPAWIRSAAAIRTRSRRARPAAIRPPPPAYLIPPAYRTQRPPSPGRNIRH